MHLHLHLASASRPESPTIERIQILTYQHDQTYLLDLHEKLPLTLFNSQAVELIFNALKGCPD